MPRSLVLPVALLFMTLLGCKVLDDLRGEAEGAGSAASSSAAAPIGSASASPSASAAPRKEAAKSGSGGFELIPLEVGQFVHYRGQDSAEGKLEMAIVGKERNAYWFQVKSYSEAGSTIVGLLLKTPPDRRDPDDFEVLSAKIKLPTGQVQRFEGTMSKRITELSKQWLHRLTLPNFERLPRENVEVKAGKFEHCARHESKEKLMGFDMDVVSWHHPKVPITAMVKQKGRIDGRPTGFELIEYGLTGAKSEF